METIVTSITAEVDWAAVGTGIGANFPGARKGNSGI